MSRVGATLVDRDTCRRPQDFHHQLLANFQFVHGRWFGSSVLTAAAAFDVPHLVASQSDGQAPLLEDARGWEGY
jgi:hypothetical protein